MAGNIAVANSMVFVNNGGGVVIVDDKTGVLLTELHPPSPNPTFSGVTVTGGTVYWKTGGVLNAWRLP